MMLTEIIKHRQCRFPPPLIDIRCNGVNAEYLQNSPTQRQRGTADLYLHYYCSVNNRPSARMLLSAVKGSVNPSIALTIFLLYETKGASADLQRATTDQRQLLSQVCITSTQFFIIPACVSSPSLSVTLHR